jgi:hypothetical protein
VLSLTLRTPGLAAPARLFALSRKTCLMPCVSLGEFAVQTLELERSPASRGESDW